MYKYASILREVQRTTIHEEGERTETWSKLRDQWIDHYNEEIPRSLIKKRNQLLMAVRFTECFQVMCWIEFLAISGGYYIAMRELRSILEGIVQAYYIDLKYPHVNVEGKLAVLNEMTDIGRRETYGRALIKRANPPNSEQIQNLYTELCSFVHPTVDQLGRILRKRDSDSRIVELMSPKYDRELFDRCVTLSGQTICAIISINRQFVKAIDPKYSTNKSTKRNNKCIQRIANKCGSR